MSVNLTALVLMTSLLFVDTGSTASEAGLEKHDCIMRINGQNVSHLDVISVVAIVKACEHHILIEVIRGASASDACNVARDIAQMTSLTHTQPSCTSDARDAYYDEDTCSLDDSCISDVTSYDTSREPSVLAPWKRVQHMSPWELYRQLKEKQAIVSDNNYCDSCSEYSYYTDTDSNFSCSTFSMDKENTSEAKMMRLSSDDNDVMNACARVIMRSNKPANVINISGQNCRNNRASISRFSTFVDTSSTVAANQHSARESTGTSTSAKLDSSGTSDRSHLSEDSGIEVASRVPVNYHVS